MKKVIFFILALVFSVAAMAQPGTIETVTADTLNGSETVYFSSENFSGNWSSLAIQAACDNIGGTSDGTLSLEGSVDGSDWVPLAEQANIIHGFATTGENDSLTITDGANIVWLIDGVSLYKFRVKGEGTASDSTLVTVKYIYKN